MVEELQAEVVHIFKKKSAIFWPDFYRNSGHPAPCLVTDGRPPVSDVCGGGDARWRCIYINSPPTPPCWVSSLNVCVVAHCGALNRLGCAVIWVSGGVKPVMVGGGVGLLSEALSLSL